MYVQRLFEDALTDLDFFFERVYLTGGPMVTMSKFDDGILEKSRELSKFYRHTYKDLSIFCKEPCVCFRITIWWRVTDDEDHRSLSSCTTFTVNYYSKSSTRKNIVKTFSQKRDSSIVTFLFKKGKSS